MNDVSNFKNDLLKEFDKIEFLTDEEVNKLDFYELALYLQEVNKLGAAYNETINLEKV